MTAKTNAEMTRDAVYLIEDNSMRSRGDPQSGWDYDARGQDPCELRGGMVLHTANTRYGVSMKREFLCQQDGTLTFEAMFELISGNGFYYEFQSADHHTAVKVSARDGAFYACGHKLSVAAAKGLHYIKLRLDIDRQRAELFLDGVFCKDVAFAEPCGTLARVIAGIAKEDIACAVLVNAKLYKNYLINDKCIMTINMPLPCDWEVSPAKNAAVAALQHEGMNLWAYTIAQYEGGTTTISHAFPKTSGKVCFELKYLLSDTDGRAKFSLCDGGEPVVTLQDSGDNLLSADGSDLRRHCVNVWETLRIEADLDTGSALVKLNGKKAGTVAFDRPAKGLDSIRILYESAPAKKAIFKFADILVFPLYPEPADYVPEPVAPKSNGYLVGMNICSLWRNGDHWGWDVITPFDEIKPYLGYYDEGLTEVADWELKWFIEHGVDFQLFCWYASSHTSPMKCTRLSDALHGGFFHAKYSDRSKFAIMWENANAQHPQNGEEFRSYIVPYWVDYYLTDPRYLIIDHKPLITIFSVGALLKDFGSPQAVKTEMDYLREVCRGLGYEGAIILVTSSANSRDELEKIAQMGIDGIYAYNWGKEGCNPDFTKSRIKAQVDIGAVHVVPTVSTGFNNVAWAGTRSENMTTRDLETVLEWMKKDVLPNNAPDWKSRFVMLSTWNEYGEGTYMMPSGLNGFGYLDTVRKVFTDNPAHTDAKPDDHQLARLGYLFPRERGLVRSYRTIQRPIPKEVCASWRFDTPGALEEWSTANIEHCEIKDGMLVGSSVKHDPMILMKQDANIDVTNCTYIHVRMRGASPDGGASGCEIFYIMDGDDNYTQGNGTGGIVKGGPVADYYFPVYNKATWKGSLKRLRIDPIAAAGDFAIECVELLRDEPQAMATINGTLLTTSVEPIIEAEETYLPFEPQSGILERLCLYCEYNKAHQILTIAGDGGEMILTVGSNTALVNGKEIALKKELAAVDGLPMVPMSVLVPFAGGSYRVDGKTIVITR